MKKIILLIVTLATFMIGCTDSKAVIKGDLHIYTVNNKDMKITPLMIEKAFSKAGFTIGINSDIHDGLTKMYKESGFKIYNAISMYHNEYTMNLIKNHANAGVFSPMGLAIYQTDKEDELHISIVTAATQAKILGTNAKEFAEIELAIEKVITTLLPEAKHTYSDESLAETRTLLTTYSKDLKGDDWEDAKDDLEENFEDAFKEAGFVMPSYFDFAEEFGDTSPYDYYVTYSICKIDVIKAVSKVRPEAAAFAPCTTVAYKKKDEDKIVMGFTSVYNWLSSANITDKESSDALLKAQKDFEAILKGVTQ